MGKVELKKLDTSEVELSGEITTADFMAHWPTVLADFKSRLNVAGFRPGHTPDKIALKHLGEPAILTEMAERAISALYPELIKNHQLEPIGPPEVALTKLAKDNPLGFTLKVAVRPEFNLPDHKPLAKQVAKDQPLPTEVTEEELNQTIDNIRRSRVKPASADELKPDLPELSDDFVKTLGNFTSVDDFKSQLKTNLLAEKISQAKDKRRLLIIQTLGEQAAVPLPPVLVKKEQEKMLAEMRGQIEHMGLTFTDYLNHLKKTETDLKSDWEDEAKKRVMFGLVASRLAEKHALKPAPEQVAKEMDQLMVRLPETAGQTSPDRLRAYVENVLTNHLVMNFIDPDQPGDQLSTATK